MVLFIIYLSLFFAKKLIPIHRSQKPRLKMTNTSGTEIGNYQCKFCLLSTESAKLVDYI